MKSDLALFAKGLAMGAANVIPGVSGGTIALVTGIYERLISALKSCDITALRLLFTRRFSDCWQHIDGRFLTVLLLGVAVSIVSLARLFEYLLAHHEVLTMAFFFGLIVMSIFHVGKRIRPWTVPAVIALLAGAGIALGIAFLAPASENAAAWYVFLCGVVAIASMVLPGLSGSFVLILMGNYALVLGAINTLNLSIIIPLALGCAVGLIAFANVLAWVFKRAEQATLALMTGFVVGSLLIIWPWKTATIELLERGDKPTKEVITGYTWQLPDIAATATWTALALMLGGALVIALMEHFSSDK